MSGLASGGPGREELLYCLAAYQPKPDELDGEGKVKPAAPSRFEEGALAAGLWGLPYEAGPRALLLALARAGVFLANCLNRLITFLASLIPPVPDGGWEPEPIETPEMGGGEEPMPDSGPVRAVILLLAALAGLGYLLWKMRFAKLKLGGRALGRQKPRRQRGRFLPALAAAWARLVRQGGKKAG